MIPKLNLWNKIKTIFSKAQVIELDRNTQYLWKIENKDVADKIQRVLNMARPSTARNIKDIVVDNKVDLIQGQLVTIPIYASIKSKTELLNTLRDAIGDNIKHIQSLYLDATGITIKIFVPYPTKK